MLDKLGTTALESGGGPSISPPSTTPLSTERAAPHGKPISSHGCHNRRLSTTAVALAVSRP